MDRRHFISALAALAGAGLVGGCLRQQEVLQSGVGSSFARATAGDRYFSSAAPTSWQSSSSPRTPSVQPRIIAAPPRYGTEHIPAPAYKVQALSRHVWRANAPITSRIHAMGVISRLTVHHEGCPRANWETSAADVEVRLKRIQKEHYIRLKAGDIGYHFMIDRRGRIWQGRELCYQGAHVSHYNSQNIGVMLLGNFELQQPSRSQLDSLQNLAASLMLSYRIPTKRLYAHNELGNTRCPGRNLTPFVVNLRQQWA